MIWNSSFFSVFSKKNKYPSLDVNINRINHQSIFQPIMSSFFISEMNIHSEQNAHFFRIIMIISIMIDNFYNRRHTHANLNILLKDPSSKISFQSFLFSLLLLFNHSISIQSSQYIQAYDVSFDSTKKKFSFSSLSFLFSSVCCIHSFGQ